MKLDTEFKFHFFFLLLATLFASIPFALVPFLGSFLYQWSVKKGFKPGVTGLLIQMAGFLVFFGFWILGFAHFYTFFLAGPIVIFITSFRYTLKHRDSLRAFR